MQHTPYSLDRADRRVHHDSPRRRTALPSGRVAMPEFKVCYVPVTEAELEAARHGLGGKDQPLLRVEMPVDYRPALVTAEDIIHDPALRVVRP